MQNIYDSKSPVAKFVREHADKSQYNYRDIAVLAGFTSSQIIYLFTSGEAKVPLDRVPALAGALGCDGAQLFLLALRQYFDPGVFSAVQEYFLPEELSGNEMAWLKSLNQIYGSELPSMTPSIEKKLTTVLKLVK